ncbi:MAG: phage holin family protein [Actinomycetota bacterium]|nr:phage holin family protein [Actinomycetota bacterium]
MTYGPSDPAGDDRSVKELVSALSSELRTLVQKELELAKVEVKEQASRAAKAGAMFGGGAGAGYFALLLFSFAAAWGLAQLMPTALGFLIVGAVYAVVAAVLFARGRRQAKAVQPPTQAVQSLQQDVQVAKDAVSRGMKEEPYPDPWAARPWDNPRR